MGFVTVNGNGMGFVTVNGNGMGFVTVNEVIKYSML